MEPSVTPVPQSSAGPVRRTRNRDLQSRPRASRKPSHGDPQHVLDRVSSLLPFSKRIMDHYAGNVLGGRLQTLEELEEYQRQHNVDPVAGHGKQWECRTCRREFTSFQKAAIHVTSHDWKLRSWYCLEVGCQRRYGSSNELTRHKKDPHPASNNNISTATMAVPMPLEAATTTLATPTTVHPSQSTQTAGGPILSAENLSFPYLTDPIWTPHRHNRASPLPDPPEAYQRQLVTVGAFNPQYGYNYTPHTRPVRRVPAETSSRLYQYPGPLQPSGVNAGQHIRRNGSQYSAPYTTERPVELPPSSNNETMGRHRGFQVASMSQQPQYRDSQVASTSQQHHTGPIGVPHMSPTHRYPRQVDDLSVFSPDTQYDSLHDPATYMFTYLGRPNEGSPTSGDGSGSYQHIYQPQ